MHLATWSLALLSGTPGPRSLSVHWPVVDRDRSHPSSLLAGGPAGPILGSTLPTGLSPARRHRSKLSLQTSGQFPWEGARGPMCQGLQLPLRHRQK